jgi:hypothetical protein
MKTDHILGVACSLLGVSLIIVTAVHITGKSAASIADELSFGAALVFIVSAFCSHRALAKSDNRFERIASRLFALGLLLLLCGVLSFWF